jgi:two-component system OmpR family response regulator
MPKKRILIVDDEPKFTQMVRFNLEKTGVYEVMEVNHPKQALEAATRFKPDLVLLDVMMPGMDGGDVAAQFQRDPGLKDVPVMFVTAAVARSEAGQHGYRSGGDIFLAKPITLDALLAAIAENLRHGAHATNACKGP